MDGESEDVVGRMENANELAAASSEDAEEFIEKYAKEVIDKFNAGEFSEADLDLLFAKIREQRESRGH
jgi:hypothetical protein